MDANREVVFVAAENGALPGGKVGGVADVVRDLPIALADLGWRARVVTPSYGSLHKLPGAKHVADFDVPFAGEESTAQLWSVPGSDAKVENLVIHHERFERDGEGVIYFGDEPARPFARDASKFAFFCAAVASWLVSRSESPDAVHLHDWHAGFYTILRKFDERYASLRDVRTVFTIHNLSYQGIRPLEDDESSLLTWFPGMQYDKSILDPRHDDCVNPMAAAIRLADRISTVSPTYAEEICLPSDPATAFIGGEGLEGELQLATDRLTGVLNGCFYDQKASGLDWPQLLDAMRAQVDLWATRKPENRAHVLAKQRLSKLSERPATLLVSVGRLVSQKATLFLAGDGESALDRVAALAGDDGLVIILGSGEPEYEAGILEVTERRKNIVFLHGYSETLADPLYELGDVFLMPSSFEPCGISQMLAMRAGLPCVVHGVGGLRDTVEDGFTGFVFNGKSLENQADGFVGGVERALTLRTNRKRGWQAMKKAAAANRFEWRDSARQTVEQLYEVGRG